MNKAGNIARSASEAHFGLGMALAASLVAGIANIPFNAMPMILGSAADAFRLVPAQIGLLGGATLSGWVAGTALCFFILHKLSWRVVGVAGLVTAVAGLQLSLHSDSVAVLNLSWFILGFGASLPTCVAFEVIGNTEKQERSFGMMTLAVVVASALVLYLFPVFLLPRWGYGGLVGGLGILLLAMIPVVWRLPSEKAHAPERGGQVAAAGSNRAAWLALVGFLIFFGGQSGLWAFLERAGREIDVASADIGVILAILKLVGGLASITAMVAATRFGTRWPFVAAFVGIAAAGAILHFASSPLGYAVGGWVWEYFFTLTFCYATAAISRYDATGRVVLLLPGAIGLGGAIGPSVAGYLKTGEGFLAVYLLAAITMFLCMCIFLALGAKRETA